MKKKLMVLSGSVLGFAPMVAFAATNPICAVGETTRTIINANGQEETITSTAPTIGTLLCKVSQILSGVLPILIALAVIYFVWGVVSFVISDDEEAKTKGRDRIIYGVIGLAVIVGIWGLVNILSATFGIPSSGVNLPGIPTL